MAATSDGQGKTLTLLEYLFVGIAAFLSAVVNFGTVDIGRIDLA